MVYQLIGPLDKIFHIRRIGMAAIMLSPGQFAANWPNVYGGHFFGMIIIRHPQILCSQQLKNRPRCNSSDPGADRRADDGGVVAVDRYRLDHQLARPGSSGGSALPVRADACRPGDRGRNPARVRGPRRRAGARLSDDAGRARSVHAVGAVAPRPQQLAQLPAYHDLAPLQLAVLDRRCVYGRQHASRAVGYRGRHRLFGPPFGFYVPGLGRSATTDWNVEGTHMAERCSLFVIIALGESILITGATAAGRPWNMENGAAFVVAFMGSVAMWAVYFNIGAERASRHIASSDDPGRLARSGYTYIHILIVAGIISAAVGDELVLQHPSGHAEPERDRDDRWRAGALSRRQCAVQAVVGPLSAALASCGTRTAGVPGTGGALSVAARTRSGRDGRAHRRRHLGVDVAAAAHGDVNAL